MKKKLLLLTLLLCFLCAMTAGAQAFAEIQTQVSTETADLVAQAEALKEAGDYEPDETDQRHLDALAEGREAVEPDIGRLTLIAANSCDALLSRHKSIMMDMDIYAPDGLYATQKFYVDPDVSYCALSANAYSTVMTRDCFIEYLWDFDDPVYYLFDDLDVYENELAAQRKGFPIVANEDTEILYRTVEGDGLFTAYSRIRDPAFIRSFIRDAEEGSDWFHYQEGMELLQKEVFDTNSSDLLYTEVNLLYPDGKEYLYVTYEFAYDVDIHDVDEYLSAYADITDDNSRTVTVTFAPGTEEERSVEYQMVKGAYYYLWYKDQEVLVDYDDPACTVLHETSDGTEDMHIYVKESPDAADLVKQAKMLMDAENYGAAVDVLWEAAEMGDPTGLRWLGNCYANGQGVEKNDEEAVRYYRLASEQGDVLADYNLALCYLDGSGVEQDPEKAKELLLSCADRGDAESANKLGCLYYDGEGLAQNYEEAFKLFRQAADMGYMRAYGNLGVCYENGFGVEQDDVKAAECYLTAAEAGDEYGLYNLGILYRLGKGVEQDDEKAFEYASLAAAQDNAEALTALGYYYGFGVGTEQDYDEMLKYYRLAAERGEPTALFNLGCCYRDATGVEKDYEEMLRYFRLAADAGNPDAQFNLGYCYYIGQGVDQDYDTAVEFFRQAAEQELPVAMFAYGDCFYLGNGAEQDLNAAAKWYQRALNAGYELDETDRQHLADLLGKAAF